MSNTAGDLDTELEVFASKDEVSGRKDSLDDNEQSQKDNNRSITWVKIGCLGILVLIVLIAIAFITMYFIDIKSNGSKQYAPDSNNYVLPNTNLTIFGNNDTTIQGEFIVDETHYDFTSTSSNSVERIEFINNNILSNEPIGFKIYYYVDEIQLKIELLEAHSIIHTIVVYEHQTLNQNDTYLMQSFLENILCEHFVQLSIKLGALGYVGILNHVIQNIHLCAEWIWNVAVYDVDIDNSEWTDLTEQFEKVNEINTVSTDESMLYSGFMKSIQNYDHYKGRLLLQIIPTPLPIDTTEELSENCGDPISKCNNDCFGKCGVGCWCWSWVCGDCNCWNGCYKHDYHCSCGSFFSWCCLNFFWVRCDGSRSC